VISRHFVIHEMHLSNGYERLEVVQFNSVCIKFDIYVFIKYWRILLWNVFVYRIVLFIFLRRLPASKI
jgi:hypothetical protein